jgi:hypothetical protein
MNTDIGINVIYARNINNAPIFPRNPYSLEFDNIIIKDQGTEIK